MPEGIQTVLHKSGEEFSGGERKRLALLRAIVSNPNLIILDEPTAGLDPSNQEIVWNMIEGLGGEVTRIVATHDVESNTSRSRCHHERRKYCSMWKS